MRVARTRVISKKLTGEANPAATDLLLIEHIDIPTVWSA
jgi:hypothetical protein